MNEDGDDLVARIHREAWEHYRQQPPLPPSPPPTIHYTELPPSKPGDALAEEWETYRREVGCSSPRETRAGTSSLKAGRSSALVFERSRR